MENEMTGYILTLLENYAKTTNEIELLRYELQHCNIVSPEEMIETLALSRRENNPDSRYPHDVAGIAMCFRERCVSGARWCVSECSKAARVASGMFP